MSGIATPNLPALPVVDDLIGNADGATVRISLARLIALVIGGHGPTYETRSGLVADLDWAEGTIATVWGGDEATRGVYRKRGAVGSGSWARMGELPGMSTTLAALAAKADAADLADGRVYAQFTANPSGKNIAASADSVVCITGSGITIWQRVAAPSDGVETDILKRDNGGIWWRLRHDPAVDSARLDLVENRGTRAMGSRAEAAARVAELPNTVTRIWHSEAGKIVFRGRGVMEPDAINGDGWGVITIFDPAAISAETQARQSDINALRQGMLQSISQEATAREHNDAEEMQARKAAISALAQQMSLSIDQEAAAREQGDAVEADIRAAEDARRIVGQQSFTDKTLIAFTSQSDGATIVRVDDADGRLRAVVGTEEVVTVPDLYDASEELRDEMSLTASRLDEDIQARGQSVLGGRLDPDFVWALSTKYDGSVLMGLRADGRLVYDQRVPGFDAVAMAGTGYVIGPDDTLTRFSHGNPENPTNLSDLPVTDARIEQGYVRIISRRRALWRKTGSTATPTLVAAANTPLVTRLPVMASPFVAKGIAKVYAVINYGQSFASYSLPTLTVDPVAPGRALMFSAARNAPKLTTWGLTVPAAWDWAVGPGDFDRDLSVIGDLYSREGETPSPGMAEQLLRSARSVPADAALFMINLANGGVDHKNLVWPVHQDLKPADPSSPDGVSQWSGYRFEQIIRALKVLRHQCASTGLDLEVRAITYMHGEADVALGWAYQGYLEHLQGGFTDRISYITGQTYEVPVICDQADWRKAPSLPGATSWAQLQAALDNPGKIICAGPHYWIPRLDSEGSSDGLHPTAAGRRMLGHNYGRAMNTLWETGSHQPLHVSAAVRSGKNVDLTFAGNEGPLVIDTTSVSAAPDGHYGITWHQEGGNDPAVAAAVITGQNTMRVSLDQEPTGHTKCAVHIASNVGSRDPSDPLFAHYGPINGPRANIRDSSAKTENGTAPLYNWACHQEFVVT